MDMSVSRWSDGRCWLRYAVCWRRLPRHRRRLPWFAHRPRRWSAPSSGLGDLASSSLGSLLDRQFRGGDLYAIESAADPESRDALRLQVELESTRETLQATIEELETANEELQAMNEEMMASTRSCKPPTKNSRPSTRSYRLPTRNSAPERGTSRPQPRTERRQPGPAEHSGRDQPGADPCRSSEAHHSLFTSGRPAVRDGRGGSGHALNRIATTIAPPGLDKALDDTLRNGTTVVLEAIGSDVDYQVAVSAWRDDHGEIGGAVLSINDTTSARARRLEAARVQEELGLVTGQIGVAA